MYVMHDFVDVLFGLLDQLLDLRHFLLLLLLVLDMILLVRQRAV